MLTQLKTTKFFKHNNNFVAITYFEKRHGAQFIFLARIMKLGLIQLCF